MKAVMQWCWDAPGYGQNTEFQPCCDALDKTPTFLCYFPTYKTAKLLQSSLKSECKVLCFGRIVVNKNIKNVGPWQVKKKRYHTNISLSADH